MIAWLRKEIERDLSAACIIGAGGFEPQRWDTEPPGQVNPEHIPASNEVSAALGLDSEEAPCGWVQVVAYDRLNTEPPERDSRDSTAPVVLADSGRRAFEHIVRHDPRNEAARCEAELAILDEHYILYRDDTNELYEEFSVCYPPGIPGMNCGCVTCHYIGHGGVKEYGICRTVKLLASAYRRRPGYREEDWKPGVKLAKAPSGRQG